MVSLFGHLHLIFVWRNGRIFDSEGVFRGVFLLCTIHSGRSHWHRLLNLSEHLCKVIFEIQRHIKHFLFVFQTYRGGWPEMQSIGQLISHQPFINVVGGYCEEGHVGIFIKVIRYVVSWSLDVVRTTIGAAEQLYWLVLCLTFVRVFRGIYVFCCWIPFGGDFWLLLQLLISSKFLKHLLRFNWWVLMDFI